MPLGSNRTSVPAGAAADYAGWLAGVKLGTGFVTNSPILEFEAEGRTPATIGLARSPVYFLQDRVEVREEPSIAYLRKWVTGFLRWREGNPRGLPKPTGRARPRGRATGARSPRRARGSAPARGS
jgi:hypothetical protein